MKKYRQEGRKPGASLRRALDSLLDKWAVFTKQRGASPPGEQQCPRAGYPRSTRPGRPRLHTRFFFPQVSRDGRRTVRRGSEVVLGAGRVRPRLGDLGRGAVRNLVQGELSGSPLVLGRVPVAPVLAGCLLSVCLSLVNKSGAASHCLLCVCW